MSAAAEAAVPLVDLSTYGCPLHYVKARQALSRMRARRAGGVPVLGR